MISRKLFIFIALFIIAIPGNAQLAINIRYSGENGAASGSWMQHLALHKDVREGASNEWLEKVSDEAYSKL